MSMILAAYNAIKPLPPEGSEEWLAMLPGWTGWKFGQGANDILVHRNSGDLWYINFNNYNIAYVSASAICLTREVESIIIGSYTIYKACDSVTAYGLPRYYVRSLERRGTSGELGDLYAVAGVDSLTLE